ncbi:MAG TPA: GNAT family N-acetyltransferase [Polyangiaceae bacterium]|jgi:ribosomal-protein-alanine N-acetyltransferase|nr:GNAT family N-acetyltransferase [Polyangiaceae bacterium]
MRSAEQVSFRRRRPSDEAFILALGREAFTEYSWSASGHTAHMAATAHTLVAELAGETVGLVIVDVRGDRAHLAAIAVRTEWRGLGIGRALLLAGEGVAREFGAREIDLATADSNLAAAELFLRCGYRRRRRHARYYARGQHAIEMHKEL